MPLAEARVPVIAVDGPSGTGKGTLCLRLAAHLGWHFLDSGALYRVLALSALEEGIALDNEPVLERRASNLSFDFRHGALDPDDVRVLRAAEDITEAIRTEACAAAASRIAALPRVRLALLGQQRAFRRPPGLVADGRDMGSVVFPDAALKVFLAASQEERATRRFKQLKGKGLDVNLPQLLKDIAARDARDRDRATSPLKPAGGAYVLDTTVLDEESVFERVVRIVEERVLKGSV